MEIREATLTDLPAVNAICDARGRPHWKAEAFDHSGDRAILAAAVRGEIVGMAKTHFHGEPDADVPAGHFLGGIEVAPDFRRRRIGSALTRARMDWIWARATSVFYFANEHNTASIAMHEALGFRPVGRFPSIHGVTADHGRSGLILFAASRRG